MEDEVLKAGWQGFFAKLTIHGSEPFTEMIAIRAPEGDPLVLSVECGQGLHGLPRCCGDGCSHT